MPGEGSLDLPHPSRMPGVRLGLATKNLTFLVVTGCCWGYFPLKYWLVNRQKPTLVYEIIPKYDSVGNVIPYRITKQQGFFLRCSFGKQTKRHGTNYWTTKIETLYKYSWKKTYMSSKKKTKKRFDIYWAFVGFVFWGWLCNKRDFVEKVWWGKFKKISLSVEGSLQIQQDWLLTSANSQAKKSQPTTSWGILASNPKRFRCTRRSKGSFLRVKNWKGWIHRNLNLTQLAGKSQFTIGNRSSNGPCSSQLC